MYRGFNEWLDAPWTVDPRGGEAEELGRLVERYPYFELGEVLAAAVGLRRIDHVAPAFAGRPYPALWLDPLPTLDAAEATQAELPFADEANEDLVAPFTVMGDELVSETLAAILVAQGRNDEAKTMYAKLCLKNPEKSSYFAALIEQL